MPVTAKLNELVEWFNQVDATYRTELRELNELNFTRFDAKLEQRVAELDARFERRIAELDTKWERRITELNAKWERRFAEFDVGLAQLKAELVRWMFLFWAGTTFTVLGVMIALLKI
jgi:hypothetical protein